MLKMTKSNEFRSFNRRASYILLGLGTICWSGMAFVPPGETRQVIAWMAIVLIIPGTICWYLARKPSRLPVGHKFADGRKILGYTRHGDMITKNGEISTAEFLAKRYPTLSDKGSNH